MITGSLAGLAPCLIAGFCAKTEPQPAPSVVNATSHILWGDRAARQISASWKYTGAGVALNGLALIFWALLSEHWSKREPGPVGSALARGAAVSVFAYMTDYYVIPPRFTPGFEKRLSNISLGIIYGGIAIGLPLSSKASNWFLERLNHNSHHD